ncbi:MAG: hypothetical protein QXO40_04640, partial [Candidatus Aenigmatarchaeota archaeon]
MAQNEYELKKWVEKELIISGEGETLSNILDPIKEDAKKFIRLTKDGTVYLLPTTQELPKHYQIYLYFIGKAYGYVANLFNTDEVTNKELENNLKFPEGTVKVSLKNLRENGWIFSLKPGLHKLNYSKLNEAFKTLIE